MIQFIKYICIAMYIRIYICTLGGDSGAYQASLSNGVIVTTACVVTLFVTLIAA